MADSKFELNMQEIEQLEQKIGKLKETGEKTINDFLHKGGSKSVMDAILDLLPVSSKRKSHAKTSSPFQVDKFNLGFLIKNKKSFSYLFFPDEGIGKRNKVKQSFMRKGLETSRPKVIEKLNEILNKKIEEEL